MGISFRKRIGTGKAGRINVSKGGVGGSIGSKAGRFGVSSAGTPYVRGGSNGVYYRSEAGNSSGPTSSSPTSRSMRSQSPSDVPLVSANMPTDELLTVYGKISGDFSSQVDQMSFRILKGPVVEDYQQRYLTAIVRGAFNGGRRQGSFKQSERAWEVLAIQFNEHFGFLPALQSVTDRLQKVASVAELHYFELRRSEFESLGRDMSEYTQAARNWCVGFDENWNRLVELGWLPRPG